MPDTDSHDRQVVLADFKAKILALSENPFELPDVGIYDEPLRYFKANEKWCAIIFGWLDTLEDIAGWRAAQDETFEGIQEILKFEEGIELPINDCEDIEDCLETSTVINNIETNITNNTTNITNNTTNITNLAAELEAAKDASAIDGVDLPPITEVTEDDESLCKAANFMADQIILTMNEAWEAARTYSLQEYIRLILGDIWYNWGAVREFGQWAITMGNPTLNEDAAEHRDKVAQILYCNNLNIEATIAQINAEETISVNEAALIIKVLQNTRQSQFNEWSHIGAAGDDSFSCYCGNTKVWDFSLGSQLGWTPQAGNRAAWGGDGWVNVNLGYGKIIVVERAFTWPTDFVIIETRWYVSNPSAPDYNLVFGMPYVTGVFPATQGTGTEIDPYLSGADIVKSTRTGIGIERSVFSGSDKLWKVEVDFEGTPPSSW